MYIDVESNVHGKIFKAYLDELTRYIGTYVDVKGNISMKFFEHT
jgi:hypothetical protein